MSSTIKLRCLDNSGNSIFLVDSESGVYSTNTTESTNSSTGAVLLYGGLSINSTANAIGSTSGGALTIAGGASVGRDLYVGLGITTSTLLATTSISSGNLYATNITISNLISTYISGGSIAATTFTGGDLKLSGDIIIGGTLTTVNITTTNVVDTNISTTNLAVTNINNTTMTSGTILASTINVSGITTGNINFTGTLYQNGVVYVGSQWTGSIGSTLTYTSGNVGIGKISPDTVLDVLGQINVTNNSYGSPIASILGGDGTRVVLSSGSVSTTPVAIGIEDNNMWFSNKDGGYKWYSNTSASMQLTGGNMIVTGDITSFGSISDRRLKTNIETINDENALNIVTSLRSVTFDWKDDIANVDKRGLSDVGFIAQEVEELIPYAVSEFVDINSGVSYKNMKHERIIPYLVSAIRHLEKKIRDMESKNVF